MKQKNTLKYVKYIAIILIIAIFSWSCLLPVSQARAAPNLGAAKAVGNLNLGNVVFKGVGGGSTAAAKGSGKGAAASLFSGTTIGVVVILALVVGAVALAEKFVAYMLSPDPVLYNLNNTFINTGWKMMRDLCNLFFLLALLFIAFCTILQIEKYNAKKNLLTLIIFALLINFSKPIAVFIFDGSQLLMQWFINAANQNGQLTGTLATFARVGTVLKDNVWNAGLSWDLPVTFLFSIIFVFVFFIVYFCIGLFLLIRIVVIWILVIISPFAFFAMIIPDFRKMASQWWDALFRYAYVGPAIAFFLWLADRMRTLQGQIMGKNMVISDASSSLQNMPVFIPYMITIVFLFAALMMSNQFGIHFAQTITRSANKLMAWAAISALKWGERGLLMEPKRFLFFGKKLPFSLSPRAWIKGWQEHSAEIDRRALEQAMAQPRDFLSAVFKRGERPKTYFRDLQFSKLKEEKSKEFQAISVQSEYLLDQIARAKKRKTKEAQAAAAAAIELMFGENDQDDYSIDGKKLPLDPFKAKRMLLKDLTDTGMSEQQAMRHMNRIGYIALPKGNVGFWKMTRYNVGEQKWELTPDADQLLGINAKSRTVETQGYAKVAHRDSFMIEDAHPDRDIDPNAPVRVFVGVHAVGMDQAHIIAENKAGLTQFLARNKLDTLDAIAGHVGEGLYDSALIWKESSEQLAERLREISYKWDARAGRDENAGEKEDAKSARSRANEYRAMAAEALTPEGRAMRDKYAKSMAEFFDEARSAREHKKEKGAGKSAGQSGGGGGGGENTQIELLKELINEVRSQRTGQPSPVVVVEKNDESDTEKYEDEDTSATDD